MSAAKVPLRFRITNQFVRQLQRLHVVCRPFLITREDLYPDERTSIELNSDYRFCALDETDLPQIHNLRPEMDVERYAEFMRVGYKCFGIKRNDELIAKMWLNFRDFNSVMYQRVLEDDEIYLFDAYCNPAYRGQNLAPCLRLRCYEQARALGRQRIYSITDYTNHAARNFKAKLGARHVELSVMLRVRGGRKRVITLRRYSM